MDIEKFKNSPTGSLTKIGDGEAGYYTFTPSPLPPTYTPSATTIYALSQADRALGELAGLSRMLPNPTLLIRPFIRREAVLSSRIEGTQAGIEDVYRYEIGQLTLPGLPQGNNDDVREVYNYVRALEYGVQRLNDFPLSLRFIRELHGILMDRVRGEHATPGFFRRTQNWIGAFDSTLNNATFVPPSVDNMHKSLNDFEQYLHTEQPIPPLIRLAFIHYQFEVIHPFIDGNGRIGRLLITLLLVHWGILPAPLLYLSVYFERYRQQYYAHLFDISCIGTWDKWIQFFLKGVAEQASDGVSRAKALQELQAGWLSQLEKARVSGLTIGVTNYLLEQPIVTANTIRERFDLQHTSAIRLLRRLTDIGILTAPNEGSRNQQFIALELVKILS